MISAGSAFSIKGLLSAYCIPLIRTAEGSLIRAAAVTVAGEQILLVSSEQLLQSSGGGVEGKPGGGGVIAGAPGFDTMDDDSGAVPTHQLLSKVGGRQPVVDSSDRLAEAANLDHTVMLAGRIGGLIDTPGPLGPIWRGNVEAIGWAGQRGGAEYGSSMGEDRHVGEG